MNKKFTDKEIEEIEIKVAEHCSDTKCRECVFCKSNHCRTALVLKIALESI